MKLTNIEDIKNYLVGGKAEFTLKSLKTGNHHTYKTRILPNGNSDRNSFFVSHLTGSDNESYYLYLGVLTQDLRLIHTKASPAKSSAGFAALSWFLSNIGDKRVEFYHTGKCSACGRKLTTPESIECGMGPVCRKRLR